MLQCGGVMEAVRTSCAGACERVGVSLQVDAHAMHTRSQALPEEARCTVEALAANAHTHTHTHTHTHARTLARSQALPTSAPSAPLWASSGRCAPPRCTSCSSTSARAAAAPTSSPTAGRLRVRSWRSPASPSSSWGTPRRVVVGVACVVVGCSVTQLGRTFVGCFGGGLFCGPLTRLAVLLPNWATPWRVVVGLACVVVGCFVGLLWC